MADTSQLTRTTPSANDVHDIHGIHSKQKVGQSESKGWSQLVTMPQKEIHISCFLDQLTLGHPTNFGPCSTLFTTRDHCSKKCSSNFKKMV